MCLLIVLSLAGGHAAGLQLVAWAGMLATRAPTQGFTSAVRSTFGGADPCQLCEVVKALSGAENALPAERTAPSKGVPKPDDKGGKRLDLALSSDGACTMMVGETAVWHWPSTAVSGGQCVLVPEPPPPRLTAS